jgi:nanoRNase/pAp phosphatase (c-di-AMP/oligoRNAs hydrolase)
MRIITTHKSADFDAFSCSVAASILYEGSEIVFPNSMNPNVQAFYSIHKDIFDGIKLKDIDMDEITELVVVDTGSWRRLEGQFKKLIDRDDLKITIWDHHQPGDIEADYVVREYTGAAVSLFIEEFIKQSIKITPVQATLFLLGLYEDTGSLSFTSTQPKDAYAAAYLLEHGADLNVISNFLRPVYGEKQKEVLFDMIQEGNDDVFEIGGHRVGIHTKDIEGHVGNLSVVINMYREIMNVDAAFGIFSDSERDRTFIIGRSSTEDINVGVLMRSLGGGGHPGAGSAMLKGVNKDEIITRLKYFLEGNNFISVKISDLMSYPVLAVDHKVSMKEVKNILIDKGCTGLPVTEENKLVGVISRRDFRKVKQTKQMDAPVKAFMSGDPIFIDPDKTPMEAAKIMVKHDIGRLPVLKEGEIIGIVSRSDTMRYFYDLLPD